MNRIEALTDGLCRMTDFSDPSSAIYRYRNPLGLRVFCVHGKGVGRCEICPAGHPLIGRIWREREWDHSTGVRVFHTLMDGYQASLFDVKMKCSGKSHAAILESSPLSELCISYGISGSRPADALAKFLRRALDDDSIRADTAVSFFVNGGPHD
jgi:hypothetical protein